MITRFYSVISIPFFDAYERHDHTDQPGVGGGVGVASFFIFSGVEGTADAAAAAAAAAAEEDRFFVGAFDAFDASKSVRLDKKQR